MTPSPSTVGDDGAMTVPRTVRWIGLCIDCADADQLADFYSRVLGWEVAASDGHGWAQLRDPDGGVGINIQAESWYRRPTWPETADTQHKMMHLEIEVDDLTGAIDAVIGAGGTIADHQPDDRDQSRIRVMLDPAGHPFCLFVGGE